MLAAMILAMVMAPQRGQPPTRKAYDPFHDPNVQKQSDDSLAAETKKKLDAERLLQVTEEKQKVLARDAEALVQMVTELQGRVVENNATKQQVEAIEKLARSMKKRAKGDGQ